MHECFDPMACPECTARDHEQDMRRIAELNKLITDIESAMALLHTIRAGHYVERHRLEERHGIA